MQSKAIDIFRRLEDQVEAVRSAAAREAESGNRPCAEALWRSCIVLAVAGLDTYMHERGTELLHVQALRGPANAESVAAYLERCSGADVSGVSGLGLIRLRLSYKTLMVPAKIDQLLEAAALDANQLWQDVSIGMGTRPDRLKTLVSLQVDRRNQIAHEGDWDSSIFDLRNIENSHASESMACVSGVVR